MNSQSLSLEWASWIYVWYKLINCLIHQLIDYYEVVKVFCLCCTYLVVGLLLWLSRSGLFSWLLLGRMGCTSSSPPQAQRRMCKGCWLCGLRIDKKHCQFFELDIQCCKNVPYKRFYQFKTKAVFSPALPAIRKRRVGEWGLRDLAVVKIFNKK